MSYIDQVKQKRQLAQAAAADESRRRQVLGQLSNIEQATLNDNNPKPGTMTAHQQRLFDTVREILETDEKRMTTENHQEVVGALRELKDALLDSGQSTQHMSSEIREALDTVTDAVRSLDMSPVINTPAPIVKITEKDIDFSPLQSTMREAMRQKAPEMVLPEQTSSIDRFDLSRYRAQDITETEEYQYVGFVNPEGDWYIIENDPRHNRMRYVFGKGGYSKHFRQASSFKYQLLDKAIHASA